jgi:hypothetical protein
MKKLFLLALVVMSVFGHASAQYDKSILVYGDGGYSSSGQYNASVGIGYQFSKKWTVGGAFNVSDMGVDPPSLLRTYGMGGFARYTEYFGNENRFFWYLQGNAGYFSFVSENNRPGEYSRDSWDGFTASLAPGVGINLPRGFAITFTPCSISYRTGMRDIYGNRYRSGYLDASIGRGVFSPTPAIGITKNFRLRPRRSASPSTVKDVHTE